MLRSRNARPATTISPSRPATIHTPRRPPLPRWTGVSGSGAGAPRGRWVTAAGAVAAAIRGRRTGDRLAAASAATVVAQGAGADHDAVELEHPCGARLAADRVQAGDLEARRLVGRKRLGQPRHPLVDAHQRELGLHPDARRSTRAQA